MQIMIYLPQLFIIAVSCDLLVLCKFCYVFNSHTVFCYFREPLALLDLLDSLVVLVLRYDSP